MKLRGGTFSRQNTMRVLRKKQTHIYYRESLYNSVLQKLAALFCTKHNAWQFASLPLLIFFPVHSRETRIRLDFKQLVQCYTLNQSQKQNFDTLNLLCNAFEHMVSRIKQLLKAPSYHSNGRMDRQIICVLLVGFTALQEPVLHSTEPANSLRPCLTEL